MPILDRTFAQHVGTMLYGFGQRPFKWCQPFSEQEKYSKIPHKRTHLFQFGLILFLYIGSFLQNQPEDVLKVFLKLFLEIINCIDYQQLKLMCNHNVSLNNLMILALTE